MRDEILKEVCILNKVYGICMGYLYKTKQKKTVLATSNTVAVFSDRKKKTVCISKGYFVMKE